MKTIFDNAARNELITRIKTLNSNSTAQWGKMNVYQMLAHCSNWEEWVQGKNNPVYKRSFIGFLFGRMALKAVTKDDEPLRRNTPSTNELIIKEISGDVEAMKQKWITGIEAYAQFSNPQFVHDFFGKMTKEQIGVLAYKHTDHHLRQFGN